MPPPDARSCRSSAAGTRDPHGWSAPPAGPSPRASSGHARRCASGRLQDGGCGPSRPLRPAGPTPVCRGESSREKLRWPLQPLPGHHARPPTPQRQAPAAAPTLVHNGGNRLVTSLNRSFNYHPLSIAEHVVKVKLFRDNYLRVSVTHNPSLPLLRQGPGATVPNRLCGKLPLSVYLPLNAGRRFSRKAWTASLWSSVVRACSWATWASSMLSLRLSSMLWCTRYLIRE